ncbi:hypothetical protein [uncultured Stenotrophomonas sp.]|uniref:hypothetical protein n=1 Tax=uncultured Stenotrophomonas sp. TaxID=165438 RepID=UPI00258CE726|nr:hypothetical protein [uncultured Stenotrophomonas sp.]
MRASDVFKPQGTPTVTLVKEPIDQRASQRFDNAIEDGGKLIRVIGPSKSGKTVFVTYKRGTGDIIRVSASGVKEGADLWTRVLASAGGADQVVKTVAIGGAAGVEVSAKASAGVLIAKAETEGKVKVEANGSKATAQSMARDPLHSVVQLLRGQDVWVFIDDFHYLKPEIQEELAEQIKYAAEENVQLIIALIPGRSEDILQANSDIRGRILDIAFDYWDVGELSLIAETGFPSLGVRLPPGSAAQLAQEAAGTPQLMQAICLELAREVGAREAFDPPQELDLSAELKQSVFRNLAETSADFSTTVSQMKKGPPTRGTPRKSYTVAGGQQRDVYELLVKAFGMNPPQLKLTTDEIQARVDALAGEEVASVWESVRHMSLIANGMNKSPLLDFGGDLKWVSILDPYLLFALRWGDESPAA